MIHFEKISQKNLEHYEFLFRQVFGNNSNNDRVDFRAKSHLNSSVNANLGLIAFKDKQPIGAIGAYPIQ